MIIWCDRIVTGGILFLIFFTPLAFGSVHPWAFSLMEGMVFLLVTVWMGKHLYLVRGQRPDFSNVRGEGSGVRSSDPITGCSLPFTFKLVLPLVLFVTFILFQLLPLPPYLLHLLSPSTYELYSRSLPGWPEKMSYQDLSFEVSPPQEDPSWALLPTIDEVQKGVPVPFAKSGNQAASAKGSQVSKPHRSLFTPYTPWFPLSITPSLTRTDLLKFIAYAALFFLVLLYPFGDARRNRAEERFFRSVLLMVLLSGVIVAVVGFLERFAWNGKLLWFFVPYDWGAPQPGAGPRASGPFVNPDHFGNYLSLIFPVALVGALFRTSMMPKDKGKAFRLICGFAAFVLFSGILLSLSRAAWTGVLLAGTILLWFFIRLPEGRKPSPVRKRRGFAVRLSLAALCLLLVLSLFFVGPGGRRQVDTRLEETVMHDSGLRGRTSIWKDSLGMVRDFPFFGVGLGAWPELFPRYQSPPWSPDFYRESHNDYVELLAEAGLVGCGLLIWFFWRCGKRLLHGLKTSSVKDLYLLAAFLSALAVMAFHEFFDFNLQIPANAFLFTLFLALALRMKAPPVASQPPRFPASLPAAIAVASFILLGFVLNQKRIPYPYNLKEPASVGEARELLLSHPARSSTHLSLFRLLENKAPPFWQLRELAASVWLDPRNPYARDLYAAVLLRQGRKEEGLKEITRSVFYSPSLSTHFYLSGRLLPWLSAEEQKAVEDGFKKSLRNGYAGAMSGLADFYASLGRFSDQGKLYEEAAAAGDKESKAKASTLIEAGLAYVRAGEKERAETLFRQAILVAPEDLRSYRYLATLIYAPQGDLDGAKTVISEGIKKGGDPFSLYLALAEAAKRAESPEEAKAALSSARAVIPEVSKKGAGPFSFYLALARAAQNAGDHEGEKSALFDALDLRPSSFGALFRLGLLYLQENNFDRAALHFGKASDLNPGSADAFYHLAVAEEGRYRFFAAEKAYARAVELAPDHAGYKTRHEALKRKVGANTRKESSRAH